MKTKNGNKKRKSKICRIIFVFSKNLKNSKIRDFEKVKK